MTPLIPQEIYLIERYTSAEYFKKLRDAFAETVQAAEDALAEIMRTLPREYRRRPRWQQPDITWGGVVLPNFRDTLQMVEGAYLALLRGDLSAIEMAGNVNTAFAGQGRDYPCDWMPSAFLTRFMNGYVKSSTYAGNIAFTAFIGWIKGSLSTRYNADSRGPLNAPPSWPIYRLNPAVRVATDEAVKITGVYLPDADDSCAQFFYAGPPATSASVGYDPNTGQNIDEVDTVWTLVERVADGGEGVPGDDASSDAGIHLRISRSISALSRTYLPSPPAHQNRTQGRYALPRHSGENDDAAGWQTQPMLPAILVLLSLPATFFAIAWAALQPPVVAGVFYLASLTVWLIHGAWRHYVTKTPPLPIPGVLAALAPFSLSVSLGRRLFPLADGILQNAISVLVCLLAISLPGALHSRLERLRFLRDTETPSPPPLNRPASA